MGRRDTEGHPVHEFQSLKIIRQHKSKEKASCLGSFDQVDMIAVEPIRGGVSRAQGHASFIVSHCWLFSAIRVGRACCELFSLGSEIGLGGGRTHV